MYTSVKMDFTEFGSIFSLHFNPKFAPKTMNSDEFVLVLMGGDAILHSVFQHF